MPAAKSPRRRRRLLKRSYRRRRRRRTEHRPVALPITAAPAQHAAGTVGERPAPLHLDWDPEGILAMLDIIWPEDDLLPAEIPVDGKLARN